MFEENKALEVNVNAGKAVRWADFLLLSTAFLLMFWGLGGRSLWGSEGRWAEVVREMLLTKDFFHPTIGGEPYFDKPLLTYWLIAAISAVTGTLNEWVVRAPSAIAGVIAVWATVLLGRRLWSSRVGSIAGWLLLTSYGVLFWSRTAAADTENLAAITLCILWYWSRRDRPNFTTFMVFYLIAFLGALTKGLPAVVIPIVAILPDLVMENRWKNLFRPSHFLALAAGIAIYLAPFIYASSHHPQGYNSSGLALVFQENILRFFRPIDHKGPVYTYLYAVPMLILPWAPLFIAGLTGLIQAWKNIDKKTRWLIIAIALIFLFFTLSGSRRDYYILPITPLCALLIAVFLVHESDDRISAARMWGIGIQRYVCITVILLEIALPFVLLILKLREGFEFFVNLSLSGIVLGAIAFAVWLIAQKTGFAKYSFATNQTRQVPGLIAVTVIVFGGFFCWQQNLIDSFRTGRPFIMKVRSQTSSLPASGIGFFPKTDAKFCYYLGKTGPIQTINSPEDWQRFSKDNHPRILITRRKYLSSIPPQYNDFTHKTPDIAEEITPWDSASSSKDKWVAWFINYNASGSNKTPASKEKTKDEVKFSSIFPTIDNRR